MSAPVAILCSGQGTQHAGMFDLVAQAPEAQPVLAALREFLDGREPSSFVREADAATLFSNRAGQLLCCTQALAAWAMLRAHLGGPVVLAGYSVGELAAWGCAGLLQPTEVLRLAEARAVMMDEAAGKGTGLAALTGLSQAKVATLCHAHDAQIAIINAEDFFIVGGRKVAVEALRGEALQAGASGATLLRVAVASHTPLLSEAGRHFGALLDRLGMPGQLPDDVRLLSGLDGDAVFDVNDGRHKLAAQISQTLNWAACLESCRSAGAETFLELGPGNALANMARRLFPAARVRSVEDFRTPAGIVTWLEAAKTDEALS